MIKKFALFVGIFLLAASLGYFMKFVYIERFWGDFVRSFQFLAAGMIMTGIALWSMLDDRLDCHALLLRANRRTLRRQDKTLDRLWFEVMAEEDEAPEITKGDVDAERFICGVDWASGDSLSVVTVWDGDKVIGIHRMVPAPKTETEELHEWFDEIVKEYGGAVVVEDDGHID